MAFNAGHIEATLTGRFDDRAFKQFDRAVAQAQRDARRGITATAHAKTDTAGFTKFDREVRQARQQARRDVTVRAGAKTDTSGFNKFDREVRGASGRARRGVIARLGARLDHGDFSRYDASLRKAQAMGKRGVRARLWAVADVGEIRTYDRAIEDARRDAAKPIVARVDTKGVHQANTELNTLGKTSRGGAAGLVGVGAAARSGVGGLAAMAGGGLLVSKVFSEWSESVKSGKEIEQVIRSTGGAAGVTAKQVGDLANAISLKTGIDDEAIQKSEGMLLTFTKIRNEAGRGNDVFTQATRLVQDMSVKFGGDATKSAIQLGKALQDPVKGVTALRKIGVDLDQSDRDHIETLVKKGKVMEAQKIILAELTKEVGGQAEAQATPLDKLRTSFNNLLEAIGYKIGPAVNAAAGAVSKVLIDLSNGLSGGGKLGKGFAAIGRFAAQAFGQVSKLVGPLVGSVGKAFWSIGRIMKQAFGGGAGREFLNDLKAIGVVVGGVAVTIARFAMAIGKRVLPGLVTQFKGIVGVVKGVVRVVAGVLTLNPGKIFAGFKSIVGGVGRILGGLVRIVSAPMREAAAFIGRALGGIGKAIAGAFRGAAGSVGRAAGSVGHAIAGAFRGVIGWVKDAFRDVTRWIGRAFSGAAGNVGRGAKAIGHAIAGAFRDAIGWVKGAFRDVAHWIPKALSDAAGAVGRGASKVATTLWNGLKGLPGKALSLGGNIAKSIARGLSDAFRSATGFVGNIGRSIANWLNDHTPLGDKVSVGPISFRLPRLAKGGPVVGPGDPVLRAVFAAAGARRMATGGTVDADRVTGGGDTVPALLTPGEFVMSKPAVDRIGTAALSAANSGKGAGALVKAAAAELAKLVPTAKKAGTDSAAVFGKALAAGAAGAKKAGVTAASAVGAGLGGAKTAATKAGSDTRRAFAGSLGRMDDDARSATRNVTRAMDANLAGGARVAAQRGTSTRRAYTAGIYGMRSDADRHTRAVANAVRSHLGQAATSAGGQGRRTRTAFVTPLFGMRSEADRHTRAVANAVRQHLGQAATNAGAAGKRLGNSLDAGLRSADVATQKGLNYILAATRKALSGMGGKMPTVTISVPPKFASGSWVGRPGERGRDTVHALLGRGEAVLTRHQQRHVERALRISRRLGGPIGSLRELFSRERTPHSHARVEGPLRRRLRRFAGGGLVGASDFGGHDDPSAYHHSTKSGLIMDDSTWGYAELSHPGTLDFAALGNLPMGTILAITYGGQTVRAPKIDVGRGGGSVGGHPRAIDLTYAVAQRLARGRWPGLAVVRISGPQGVNLHLGANSGAAAPKLKRPKVGGSGPVRELVALALDKVGDAAQSKLNRTAAAMSPPSGGTGWSGGPLPRGLGTFDGRPVAAWIVPQLRYARAHGWTGPITSGYRTPAENRAAGGAPNSQHMRPGPYPFGAVDFGGGYGYWDPVAAANRHAFFVALRGYNGPKLIPANGPDRHMGGAFLDWGHASGTGGETGGWLNGEPFAVGGVAGDSLLTDDGELIGYPDTNMPGGLLGALAERAQPFSGGGLTGHPVGPSVAVAAPQAQAGGSGLSSGTFFPYINRDTTSARWGQLYRVEQRGSQHVHVYSSGATVVAIPGQHRDVLSGYSYTDPKGSYVNVPATSPLAKYPPPHGVYVHQGGYNYQTPAASGAPIGVGRPPAPVMGWRGAYYIQKVGTGFAVTVVRDTSPLAPYGPPKDAIGAWYMDGKGSPGKWVPAGTPYFPWLTRPYGTHAPAGPKPAPPPDPNAPSEDNPAEAYLTVWERGFLHGALRNFYQAEMNTPYDPMTPDPKAYLDDIAAGKSIAGVWKSAFNRLIGSANTPFDQISAVGQAYKDAWDTYYVATVEDYKNALSDAQDAIDTGGGGGDYGGGTDTGGDVGTGDGTGDGTGTDTGTTAPSAADIAAAAYQQLLTFNQSRADLFSTYGGNLVTGPIQGDPTAYAAGRRYWGAVPQMATGGIAGSGGPTTVNITQHFASGPPEPHNHAQSLAWEVRTAV